MPSTHRPIVVAREPIACVELPLEMITADDHRCTLLSHRSARSPSLRAMTDASRARPRHPFFTLRRLNSEYDPGRRRARLRLRCERCATSVGWVHSSRVCVVSSRRRITSAIGRLVYSLCCVVSPCGSLPKTCLGILIRVARSSATGRRRSSLRVLDAVSASTCCLLLRLVGATEGQRTIRPERQLQSSLPLYSKSPRPSKCSHPQATLAANWATMTLA
jgi:hypothetical protein